MTISYSGEPSDEVIIMSSAISTSTAGTTKKEFYWVTQSRIHLSAGSNPVCTNSVVEVMAS